jgi:hypothetical protein
MNDVFKKEIEEILRKNPNISIGLYNRIRNNKIKEGNRCIFYNVHKIYL